MAETRGRKPIEYTKIEKERMLESGKRIKILIEESKISQRKIAKELHVDPKMIRRYQTGKQMIPEHQAAILAKILDVSPEYILCRSNYPDCDFETYDDEQQQIVDSLTHHKLHLTQVIDAQAENFFRILGFDYYHNWPMNMSFEDANSPNDIDDSLGTHFLYNIHTGKQLEFNSEGYKKLKEALIDAIEFQSYKNAQIDRQATQQAEKGETDGI